MKRRSLSTRERVALFQAAGGVCHICSGRITVGEAWEVEHVIPLAQGGEDGGDNLRPAHVKCHRQKSSRDATDTARAKRREAKHVLGIRKPSSFPCSRNSKWKKKVDGAVVRREPDLREEQETNYLRDLLPRNFR